MNKVTMTHPDLEATIDVAESAVPFHMASGWMPVDGKVAKAEKDNVPADMVTEPEEAVKPARKRTASEES